MTDSLLQLAEQFVTRTNTHIFLTGRAGTGKTTFLRRLPQLTPKRHVVLAPTGVAAINAGGQTIHSFFQLPFGPIAPGSLISKKKEGRKDNHALQLRKSKIDLIRSLDLIVIDEISMVRADLLDAIDEVLRHYRRSKYPFGGLQLLMIGDLLQLPPIVKGEEWDLLSHHYNNPFFYSSKALAASSFMTITLERVFRQSDDRFIALLNAIRSGTPHASDLEALNRCYIADTTPFENQGYITLTTHNRMADEINQGRLEAIKKPVFRYMAEIKGDFPEHIFPTQQILELKVGTRVIFIKNDPGPEKRYYNGLIGTIVDMDEDQLSVEVACEGYDETITAQPIVWENVSYDLERETNNIIEKVNGTFTQLPLRLAWAITIHKSQGLTFDKVIIDAAAAFDHGQVYVALSRCRSLEGLVFKSRIPLSAIKRHEHVNQWLEVQKAMQPDHDQLRQHSKAFVRQLLTELFDFDHLRSKTEYLQRSISRNVASLQPGLSEKLTDALDIVDQQLAAIAKKFEPQLHSLIEAMDQEGGETRLSKRLEQAAAYFIQHLGQYGATVQFKAETDDKLLRKSIAELQQEIREILAVKKACFAQISEGFSLEPFLRARALAGIDQKNIHEEKMPDEPEEIGNEEAQRLKSLLMQWRKDEALRLNIIPSRVMPLSALFQIAMNPPSHLRQLQKVKGIGKTRFAQYGEALFDIINKALNRDIIPEIKPPVSKSRYEQSLDIYLNNPGSSLESLAELRGVKPGTFAEHLCLAIEKGSIGIPDFLDKEKIAVIEDYFQSVDDERLGPAREVLGEEFGWEELKMVRAAMRHRGFWKNRPEEQL
ncbi:MAG TPA: AAA family ATPase [Bacteroidales bacterium]|nr:AAA family ATPase [Bacteroidales bacterium]